MMRLRTALAILLATVLAACGGAAADPDAPGGLGSIDFEAALEQTLGVQSIQFDMRLTMTTPMGELVLSGEGISLTDRVLGEMRMRGEGSAADTIPETHVIFADGVQYLSGAAQQQYVQLGAPAGAEWLAVPMPELTVNLGSSLTGSATDTLRMLRDGAVGEIVEGSDERDGVTYTTFATEVSFSKVLEQRGVSTDDALAQQPGGEQLLALPNGDEIKDLIASMTYDTKVWIDADGLVRRMTIDNDLSGLMEVSTGVDTEFSMLIEMDIVAVNVPVDITVPTEGVVEYTP